MSGERGIGSQTAAAVLMLGCSALGGCIIEGHHDGYAGGYYPPASPSTSIPVCPSGTGQAAPVSIDTDKGITTAVGEGTGVFVEYQAGGHWHVFTSCDTIITGYGCTYDVTAQVFGSTVSNVRGEDLETNDVAGSACPNAAYLSVSTGSNFDGMLFDAPAGAKVRVTAALGGALYPNLIYWVDADVARSDANSNPLDLTPTAP